MGKRFEYINTASKHRIACDNNSLILVFIFYKQMFAFKKEIGKKKILECDEHHSELQNSHYFLMKYVYSVNAHNWYLG